MMSKIATDTQAEARRNALVNIRRGLVRMQSSRL
jgi:hypothetical protein